jgi:hypothetical protein
MVTKSVEVSNPVNEVFNQLTGKSDFNIAASIVLKEFLQLKRQIVQNKITDFGKKYDMDFAEFELACEDGRIPDPFSYEVEKDTWDWEAALSEKKTVEIFLQWLE